jgi:hypothetical protein
VPPLLSALLSLAQVDVGGAVSRRAKSAGYVIAAAVFLLTAYIAGVVALSLYLAERMHPWAALAVVAAGFAVAAALTLWVGARTARAAEERDRELAAARQEAALGALSGFAFSGSAKSLIAAALAGLVAGGLFTSHKDPDSPSE